VPACTHYEPPPERKSPARFDGGIPQSDGNGGSAAGPGDWYRYRQVGRLQIYAAIACVLVIIASLASGLILPVILVVVVVLIVISLFSTMTISLTRDELVMHFGPVPVIRKRIRLAEIVSAVPVTNPWYYGWGIHLTPPGWLYNIAGSEAIELLLAGGKILRIGTDESEVLPKAIKDAGQ